MNDFNMLSSRAGKPWSADDEAELRHQAARGVSLHELAAMLARQPGEVRQRLAALSRPSPSRN